MRNFSSTILIIIRSLFGFIFLWAFLDKTFGLGLSTSSTNAWISGGSPTTGFLTNAVQGPFVSFFQGLAGNVLVDWLFMLGLLFVGLSFLFNKYLRMGGIIGAIMMILMYFSLLWPTTNPFVDSHLMYALVLLYFGVTASR